MMIAETPPTIRFRATLDDEGSLTLPTEASAQLPSLREAMVEGTLDGFPFRGTIDGGSIVVSAALQAAAGTKSGDAATVEITRVGEEPEVRVPPDFRTALEQAAKANTLFEEVTPNARREWVRWISSAKQEKTRQKRIEVGIDKLSEGMRRPCCFPGLNFVTKGLVEPHETWIPLPGARDESEV
jgi:hypothetical protein